MTLLFVIAGALISSTYSLYYPLTDSSGSSSYMAQITDITSFSFQFILYKQSSYSSSPICKDCMVFNDTLQTNNMEISVQDSTISIHIISDQLYIFMECPILLTISINLKSYNVEYTPSKIKNILSNKDNKPHCVFQQQQHESDGNINYIMYQEPNRIAIYHYFLPMKLNQFQDDIFANNSINPYLLYHDNIIYFISFSMNRYNNKLNLDIASYNVIDKTWTENDDVFSEIYFDQEIYIQYAGIHLTKHGLLPMLNIFLKSHNSNNYEILSWLIDSDIFSIHKYTNNPDNPSIVINDYNIHLILSPITDKNYITYYNDINSFLSKLKYTRQYMEISFNLRRRLKQYSPECEDSSTSCPWVADDCHDEGIKDLCRQTCNSCEPVAFNCSDWVPSTNTAVDICQFPRESPSFCADDWFQYFCPISCKHVNCSEIWATSPPTPLPTLITTTFESTEISTSPTIQIIDTISPTMDPTNIITSETTMSSTEFSTTTTSNIEAPINGTDNGDTTDMSLILILLAVLLTCIFVAAILLWICMNIVRLQRDKIDMRYNAMAAMATSSRTPDYIHGGYAPSTPDYYRTDIQHHRHLSFRMKG